VGWGEALGINTMGVGVWKELGNAFSLQFFLFFFRRKLSFICLQTSMFYSIAPLLATPPPTATPCNAPALVVMTPTTKTVLFQVHLSPPQSHLSSKLISSSTVYVLALQQENVAVKNEKNKNCALSGTFISSSIPPFFKTHFLFYSVCASFTARKCCCKKRKQQKLCSFRYIYLLLNPTFLQNSFPLLQYLYSKKTAS